jgi:hypothetical protein
MASDAHRCLGIAATALAALLAAVGCVLTDDVFTRLALVGGILGVVAVRIDLASTKRKAGVLPPDQGLTMKRVFAEVWPSGLIEFRDSPLPGTVTLCSGPEAVVRSFVGVTARHGKGQAEGLLLVPGLPEAKDQSAAMDALLEHMDWLRASAPDGITLGR